MDEYTSHELAYQNGYAEGHEKGYKEGFLRGFDAGKQDAMKWIPVTERLPQEGEHKWITCEVVQVLLNDGAVTVGYCNRGQKLWYHLPLAHTFFVGSSYEKTPVVAWQPLAEPPKGE